MASGLYIIAQLFYSQVRNIFQHISLRDLPRHRTKKISFRHQVSVAFVSGNFSAAPAEILDSNILL